MTPEHVRKMIACAPLLPSPGDDVVRELGEAYLALHQQHEDTKRALQELTSTTVVCRTMLVPTTKDKA